MRNVCLSLMMTVAVCAASLLPSDNTCAQSAPKPAVVISLAPLGEQMDDIKYLVSAAGFKNMNFLIQSQIKHFTSGIDQIRPSGVMLFFKEDSPEPQWLGFVAVEEVEDMLDRIADFADVDEDGDLITITPENGDEIVAKESDGFLLIADDPQMFDLAPTNPVEMLGDLPEKFNLAARVYGQRVPEQLRKKGIELITEGYARQMEELGKDNDNFFDAQMEQIKSFVNDTEEIMIGFKADKDQGKLTSKVIFRGTPGSELAKRCNVMKDMATGKFAGFLNSESAFDANVRGKIIEADIQTYNALIDQIREQFLDEIDADGELEDAEFSKLETVVDEIIAVMKETVASGEFDTGAVMMMNKSSFNFASGFKIADPKKLEKAIKSLVEMAQEKAGEIINVQFNSGVYEDITLHTLVVEIPGDEEEARKFFGDRVTVVVGIGKDAVYLGAGKDPLTLLTSSIEKSKTAEKPAALNQYRVFLAPILRFAAGVSSEPALETMAETLEENSSDSISVFSDVIENGLESRLEIEDGILALIKAGFEAAQAGAFQGDVDEF